jgi:hypothetical protein
MHVLDETAVEFLNESREGLVRSAYKLPDRLLLAVDGERVVETGGST